MDRQDDGVAWHILVALRKSLLIPDPENIEEELSGAPELAFLFQLQLTPEIAEMISTFDRVCFIDAHTGAVPEDVHFKELSPSFQHSPLTHHLTPESLLSIIQTLYEKQPVAILVSVRGFEFEFSQSLSSRTERLVPFAVERILSWFD